MHFTVTGGIGFIGSHLVQYLIREGHDVTVIDNLCRGNLENLIDIKNDIDFHRIDILEYDKLRKVIKNTDGIFHQAALTVVEESFIKPEEYNRVNVLGTENIFKIAKESNLKVVFASSSSVYGNPIAIPIKEDAVRKPINPYGKTKLDAEFLAEKYSTEGVKIVGLRYFNVYGKGQSDSYAGVISRFFQRIRENKPPIINGDGLQVRDFVYVEDVARANLLSMKHNIDSTFINIGSGNATSILKLAQMIIESSGLDLKPIHGKPLQDEIRYSQADITFAKKTIEWNPRVDLQEWLDKIFS